MSNNSSRYAKLRFWFYAKRWFWISVIWIGISNLLFFYDYFTLSAHRVLNSNFDFLSNYLANLIFAICGSFFGGFFVIFFMEKWLRKNAFWKAILYIIVTYTLTSILIGFIGSLYLESENLDLPLFNSEVIEETYFFLTGWEFLKNYSIWLVIIISTLIVLMVNNKYGPGVFKDYLLGKYFKPKKERRIFMFADIKNATSIAEKIGEERYFYFLKDFFNDITPAIITTYGDIYQYVGDEIVISWKMKVGMQNGNAIECFYNMKKLIANKASTYMSKYGFVPYFKVGYHFGNVMVGEIGQIKRDIAFSGDVLNTTSRIQAKCNELSVDILVSEAFANIAYKLPEGIVRHNLGIHSLKGKLEEIKLVTFRNNS